MFNEDTPLRKARKAAGKTLTEVAADLGCDQSTLSRVELGQQTASKQLAEDLARHFGTISEIEILYPERYVGGRKRRAGRAA